jgi:hypothetical protein
MEKLNTLLLFDTSEQKIKFSEGKTGVVIESAQGDVALLISELVADWLQLFRSANDALVPYGNNNVSYYFLDMSRGKPTSVEGFSRNLLKTVLPSLVKVHASFDFAGWTEQCIAMIPYRESANSAVFSSTGDCSAMSGAKSFNVNSRNGEFSLLPSNDSAIRRVKLMITDENGSALRIARSASPTCAALTLLEVDGNMNTFILRAQGGVDGNTKEPRSRFTVYFNRALDNSHGRWHVALQSIFLPSALKCVDNEDEGTRLDFTLADGTTSAHPFVPVEYFSSVERLVMHLKEVINVRTKNGAHLGDQKTGRLAITTGSGVKVSMGKKLAILLGFSNSASDPSKPLEITGKFSATERPDLTRLFPACLVVHCTIAEKSICGDKMESILEMIPTQTRSGGRGELVVHESVNLNYIKVRGEHVANFELELKTAESTGITFTQCTEEVYVNLIFKMM